MVEEWKKDPARDNDQQRDGEDRYINNFWRQVANGLSKEARATWEALLRARKSCYELIELGAKTQADADADLTKAFVLQQGKKEVEDFRELEYDAYRSVRETLLKADDNNNNNIIQQLLVGKNIVPTAKGQKVQRFDPSVPQADDKVTFIGSKKSQKSFTFGKIRFDRNYVLCVEAIPIVAKGTFHSTSYVGWSVKRVEPGVSDTEPVVKKSGVKMQPFNFSGKMSNLPDLYGKL